MRRALFLSLLAACGFSPGGSPATGSGSGGVPDAPGAAVDAPVTVHDAPATPDALRVVPDAATPDAAAPRVYQDCAAALAAGVTADGVQMIDPDGSGSNAPFEAYCDMTTSGGGWTLVWVYGFTDYASFTNGANAVTPRPTWGIPQASAQNGTVTPTSTTVPTTPTSPGALEFRQWQGLGDDFLVVSNINHVIACTPGAATQQERAGAISTLTGGSIVCTIVKLVATACTNVVPSELGSVTSGVGLFTSRNQLSTYYFWEGDLQTNNWPTHDPCGDNGANQVTGVASPYGSLYLRR